MIAIAALIVESATLIGPRKLPVEIDHASRRDGRCGPIFGHDLRHMAGKRFRTRKQLANTYIWSIVAGMVLLTSFILTGMTSDMNWLFAGAAIAVVGMAISWWRDRSADVLYLVDGGRIVLRRSVEEEAMEITDLIDASLIDRVAARTFIEQHLRTLAESGMSKEKLAEVRKTYLHYCTVDIGLHTYSFGIGRRMIDGMRVAQHDLVLLRVRDGRMLLLSPVYSQDLVDSLGRALHRTRANENRA